MNLLRALLTAAAAVTAMVILTACEPQDPAVKAQIAAEQAAFDNAPAVLTGRIPYGSVNLRTPSEHAVKGQLPYGRTNVTRNGNQYAGSTPWGQTNLTFVDGVLSGKAPYGRIDVRITETSVTGRIPYGSVDLKLNGQVLTGKLPYGSVTLTLGDNYSSLTDPDVVLALAAILSEKT